MSGGNDVTKCKVESLRLEETSEFCIYGAGADQRGVGGWGGPTYGHKSLQGGAWGQSLALFGAARTGRSGDALCAMQVSQEVVGSLLWAGLPKHLDVELLPRWRGGDWNQSCPPTSADPSGSVMAVWGDACVGPSWR